MNSLKVLGIQVTTSLIASLSEDMRDVNITVVQAAGLEEATSCGSIPFDAVLAYFDRFSSHDQCIEFLLTMSRDFQDLPLFILTERTIYDHLIALSGLSHWQVVRVNPDDPTSIATRVVHELRQIRQPARDHQALKEHDSTLYDRSCLLERRNRQLSRSNKALLDQIRKRRQSDHRLRQSQKELHLVLESVDDGYWDWDVFSGAVWTSPRWGEMLGFAPQDATRDISEIKSRIHPDDQLLFQMTLDSYLKTAKSSFEVQVRMKTVESTWKWILCRGKAIEYDHHEGRPVRIIGTNVDIHTLKEYEKALLNAVEKAEQANRAKTRFLANMGHELRTPLNGILGGISILQDSDLSTEQQNLVEMILNSGYDLLGIVNNLLDLSQLEQGRFVLRPVEFPLESIVGFLRESFSLHAQLKGLAFSVTVENNLPKRILGDLEKIKQILIHLCTNAIKFTDEGSITVSMHSRKTGPANFDFCIEVSDTGIGIPVEKQKEIFENFTFGTDLLTKPQRGAGMGLSICKYLVENMEGSIDVESTPGHGSIFSFHVPCRLPRVKESTLHGTGSSRNSGTRN